MPTEGVPPLAPISAASCCNAAMRFSVEGCVVNRLSTPWPESGLMMNMCAVAGLRSASGWHLMRRVGDLGQGRRKPHRLAADARAEIVGGDSRVRLIAICSFTEYGPFVDKGPLASVGVDEACFDNTGLRVPIDEPKNVDQ